jgi:hypothetical protein
MSADDGFGRTELELAGSRNLPAPHELVKLLRARVEEVIVEARNSRGDVLTPEDTFAMQRSLASVHEGLTDYGRAFATVAKETLGWVAMDLVDAVGEQDGIPVSGLKVPDTDGTTIVIERDITNQYAFDLAAIINAVAFATMENWSVAGRVLEYSRVVAQAETVTEEVSARQELASYLTGVLVAALELLVSVGKFDPQVTKLRTFTDNLSRLLPDGPRIASTVTSTIRKNPNYKGVKIKREQPK